MHNHIAHHDITLWALGAKPKTIRDLHHRNTLYQRGAFTIQEDIVLDMQDPVVFKKCLGKERNYRNFETFFMRLINELGYEEVLQRYIFDRTEVAEDMLVRMYMGKCPNTLDGYQCRYNKADFFCTI